ncbi:penicillin-binding protein 2 [Deltaproteobacteria bacterium OttesenSCG-928-M10]|nr:penicillin-binding protein 2 [Deltaproteobacteria bacterium OttesenSCG-928-M10]
MDKNHQPFSDKNESGGGRYHILFWGMIFFFMVLGARLWHLQVVRGEELRNRSEQNRRVSVEISSPRGVITDRSGMVLVDNKASFDLCVQKMEIRDPEKLLAELSVLTGRPYEALQAKYEELPRVRQKAFPLITGLSREQLVAVESRRFRLEGISIQVSTTRQPLAGVLASHAIGYLNEISKRQLENEKKRFDDGVAALIEAGETREEAARILLSEYRPHKPGDLMGQTGVEQGMEYYLQGQRGQLSREVDSRGRTIREDEDVSPIPGHNIRLTIDSRLQALAQEQLGEKAGAIVLLDPRNFEILALASSPTFSLEDFVGGISRNSWRNLMDDPFKPMFHRAVAGQYPPGSTYKIVVALAALAEGLVTPQETIYCPGTFTIANRTFGCHNRMGHGPVNLKQSLKVSCDVYYYELGRRMGGDRMAKLAREFFGLGRKLGLEIPAEDTGVIPDSTWIMGRYKQRWRPGDTINASIGQGNVLCTPLQVAQFTAVLANGGKLYRPHIVKDIVDVAGNVVKSFDPELISEIKVDPQHIHAVQNGLVAVVNEPGGTGRRASLPDVTVAGKTGTAQVVGMARYQGYLKDQIPYKDRDHAWFTGYAPAENPEVVVAVLLEHTGGGGTFAAPVARQMLAAYFDKSIVATILPPPQVQPDQPLGWSVQ